jgi:small-conductance mechanosensitive channel
MLCFGLLVLFLNLAALAYVRQRLKKNAAEPGEKKIQQHVFGALGGPLYILIWVYGIYFAATPLLMKIHPDEGLQFIRAGFNTLFDLGVFAILFWLFFRFTHVLEAQLAHWAAKSESKLDDLVVPLVGKSLRIIVPVLGLIFALPVLGLPPEYAGILGKGTSILLIVTVAVILFQAVIIGEKAVLAEFDIKAADNLQARKIYTQVHVISKVAYAVISLFTVASILMLFQEVRQFGTSILASAGVVGIVIGFAAQKTISNLFAGFQLAMTQPIRLDDVVIVEGEWGRVEEITLTYVIIHIWDDRRLVVPLSYFIEKPVPKLDARLGAVARLGFSLGGLHDAAGGNPQGAQGNHRAKSALGPALLEFAGDRRHGKNHANPRARDVGRFLQGLGSALRYSRKAHRAYPETSSAMPAPVPRRGAG